VWGLALICLLPRPTCAEGAAAAPPAEALLRAADASRHVLDEGLIRIGATVEREGEVTRTSLDVYVRAPDHALCVFRDGSLAGRMILTAAERVWLFVPGTTHPIRISPNQRLFGGASVADVARLRFAEEFTAVLLEDRQVVEGIPCHTLALEGRTPRAAYASGTLWLGVDDGLPRRAVLALPSGKPAKDLRFTSYEEERGRTVLRRVEIHHLLPAESGMLTTLEFHSYEAESLPQELFDPKHVRSVLAEIAPGRR